MDQGRQERGQMDPVMKTMETTEEVSSDGMEKRAERLKSERSAPFATENRGRIGKKIKKDLPTCGAGTKSQKRTTLVVEQ